MKPPSNGGRGGPPRGRHPHPPGGFGGDRTPRGGEERGRVGESGRPVLHAPTQTLRNDRRDAPQSGFRSGPQQGEHRFDKRHDHRPRAAGGAEAPRGTVWLYGLHAVAAALTNPSRRLRRLLVTEETEQALAAQAPPPWPLSAERSERARLDQLLGRDIVHQGVALLADLLPQPALAQVLERPGPVLVLDQVSDPRNVGAILRSAAAFGAAAVITQERNAPDETGALAKAASGALETVPLLRAVNIARTLIALKAAGCWVVGLDAGGAPLLGTALAQRRVALVLGSEGEGLRRLTRDTCDEIAGIAIARPMRLDSLNVSAAAAIALYELARAP
ncbi:MAG: RNA methyltransferase [Acidisphaera sp.]|nr:RNA methyltransferase [Acidisphaera sp.]